MVGDKYRMFQATVVEAIKSDDADDYHTQSYGESETHIEIKLELRTLQVNHLVMCEVYTTQT